MTSLERLDPTRDQVMKKAAKETLSSRDLLHLKSRSFAYPIAALEFLKGQDEFNKRPMIQNLYNKLRELDEAEDGYLPRDVKLVVIRDICNIENEALMRDPNASLDDLINGPLRRVTESMITVPERFPMDEDTKTFIIHYGKGPVLREMQEILRSVSGNPRHMDAVKNMFRESINTMGNGMAQAIQEGEFMTASQLETYCEYVAGIIGEKTTSLVRELDKVEGLRSEEGRALGKLLQITNIAKNIREDADVRAEYADARTFFIPREFYEDFGIGNPQDLVRSPGKAREARKQAFERLRVMMESYREASVNYIRSIPDRVSGYKAFCLIPYVTAEATWSRMKTEGSEKVFAGDERATKITPGEFKNIIDFTSIIIKSERTDDWLAKFSERPGNYSFIEGERKSNYNVWAEKWNNRAA